MYDETTTSISDSLEADERLLPYMPFLLQDLWALGCAEKEIINVVKKLFDGKENIRILDLGCGKGAISVQLAAACCFNILGIDAMPEFIEDAEMKASEFNVSSFCKFATGDIHKFVIKENNFDAVIYASLGGTLGTFDEIIRKLRRQVKRGGYIIIDDGYFKEGMTLLRKGYEHYTEYKDTIKRLTSFGDKILYEISTNNVSKEINREFLRLIKKRSDELIEQKPELKELLCPYIKNQEEECDILDEYINGALWVLVKN